MNRRREFDLLHGQLGLDLLFVCTYAHHQHQPKGIKGMPFEVDVVLYNYVGWGKECFMLLCKTIIFNKIYWIAILL